MFTTKPEVEEVNISTEQLTESITVDEFRAAFRLHPAGVAVATTDADGEPIAMTVSSLTSVSADPPLISMSLTATSFATPAFVNASSIVVHLLGADQLSLAVLGATGRVDRFADTGSWYRLPSGEPVYRDTYSWLRCEVIHRVAAGSSVILIAHVIEASIPDSTADSGNTPDPLVYHARSWHRLGDQSKIG